MPSWHEIIGNALLLLALPLLFFPAALPPLGFFIVLLWYLWRWAWKASPIPKTPVNFLLLIVLGMLAIGLRIAAEPRVLDSYGKSCLGRRNSFFCDSRLGRFSECPVAHFGVDSSTRARVHAGKSVRDKWRVEQTI